MRQFQWSKSQRQLAPKAEQTAPKYIIPARQPKAPPKTSLLRLPDARTRTKPVEVAITKQKGVEVFAILMQDLEYQLNKTAKPITDPATVVPEWYHKFLDVFLKEASDKVSQHSKRDH